MPKGICFNTGRTHFKKGHPKPKNACVFPKGNQFAKGKHPRTEFKKGQFANELHPLWKGDSAGCSAMHSWIYRHKGRPKICEHCGKTDKERKLEWANKDHKYTRNPNDYMSLCRFCHRKYDSKNKLSIS